MLYCACVSCVKFYGKIKFRISKSDRAFLKFFFFLKFRFGRAQELMNFQRLLGICRKKYSKKH